MNNSVNIGQLCTILCLYNLILINYIHYKTFRTKCQLYFYFIGSCCILKKINTSIIKTLVCLLRFFCATKKNAENI